jgi:hypothetical protein
MPMTGFSHEDADALADWANYTDQQRKDLHKNLNRAYKCLGFTLATFFFFFFIFINYHFPPEFPLS